MGIKILLNGAYGKMGRMILNCAKDFSEIEKIFEVDIENKDKAENFIKESDVVIDFSSPEGALEISKISERNLKPVVIGTTGFSEEEIEKIKKISQKIPVFVSPNMSYAVNLTFYIAKILAEKLDFDIHIHEIHHTSKKDAPSGTAIRYADFIKSAGKKASISSARIGNITGEHILTFAGKSEKITLSHTAYSREVFAIGALKVALWLLNQKPGFYNFSDIFKL